LHKISWDTYFMGFAYNARLMSTCLSRGVGAVAIKHKRVIATGYNGVASKMVHCTDLKRCPREGYESGIGLDLCRGIHAEQNLINQCAGLGINMEGAIVYCTLQPCLACAKNLAGIISELVYDETYNDFLGVEYLKEAGVRVRRIA
jgi:dCMP deaminase